MQDSRRLSLSKAEAGMGWGALWLRLATHGRRSAAARHISDKRLSSHGEWMNDEPSKG